MHQHSNYNHHYHGFHVFIPPTTGIGGKREEKGDNYNITAISIIIVVLIETLEMNEMYTWWESKK